MKFSWNVTLPGVLAALLFVPLTPVAAIAQQPIEDRCLAICESQKACNSPSPDFETCARECQEMADHSLALMACGEQLDSLLTCTEGSGGDCTDLNTLCKQERKKLTSCMSWLPPPPEETDLPPALQKELRSVIDDVDESRRELASYATGEQTIERITRELQLRVDIDQQVRRSLSLTSQPELNESQRSTVMMTIGHLVMTMDEQNTARMKELIEEHGWLDQDTWGKTAAHNAWLLVQHADKDVEFQKTVLELMKPLVDSEQADPVDYAYLWDRVAVNTDQKQRYGTQGRCTEGGGWEPRPVENPDNLAQRREELGLEPMEEYVARFEENGMCP